MYFYLEACNKCTSKLKKLSAYIMLIVLCYLEIRDEGGGSVFLLVNEVAISRPLKQYFFML